MQVMKLAVKHGVAWDIIGGVHIHVDRTSLDTEQIARVLACYAAHEHVFDSFTHASRRGDRHPPTRSQLRACNKWKSYDLHACLLHIQACKSDFKCLQDVVAPRRRSFNAFFLEKRKYQKVHCARSCVIVRCSVAGCSCVLRLAFDICKFLVVGQGSSRLHEKRRAEA